MAETTDSLHSLTHDLHAVPLVRALLGVAGDDLLVLDDKNVVRYCGPGVAALLARPQAEVVGRPLRDFLSFDFLDVAEPGASNGGVPLYCTALPSRLYTRDGQYVEITDVTTPIHDAHGTLVGHVCCIRRIAHDRSVSVLCQRPEDDYSRVVEESNHRVRNNLATICALLDMEMLQAADSERQYLMNSLARTRSLALVYNLIDQRSGMVDVTMLARAVIDCARPLFPRIDAGVAVISETAVALSSRRATYLSLVLTELVLHYLRCAHAVERQQFPAIHIAEDDTAVVMTVRGICQHTPSPQWTLSVLSREIVTGLVERSLSGQIVLEDMPAMQAIIRCPIGEGATWHCE